MKFKKEFLLELLETDEGLVHSALLDTTRWSIVYERVYKIGDKYYHTTYRVGATECQDERPYEYDPDEIECEEVFPVEIKKIEYLSQKEIESRK